MSLLLLDQAVKQESAVTPRSHAIFRLNNWQAKFKAVAFTGGGVNTRLRPTGRSGCVTTAL